MSRKKQNETHDRDRSADDQAEKEQAGNGPQGHHSAQRHSGHDDGGHDNAGHDHSGHEQMFRRRFWISLVLSIPVLLTSEMLQGWLGFSLPPFPGDGWVGPVFSTIVFVVGGLPFLQMAWSELRERKPGMMALISLAITVAFVFSMATVFVLEGEAFFWELVTLIDVMLLGHWIENAQCAPGIGRARQAGTASPRQGGTSGRRRQDRKRSPSPNCAKAILVLVRPGASIPVDGSISEGGIRGRRGHDHGGIPARSQEIRR